MTELRALISRHCHGGVTTSPIPRLLLSRVHAAAEPYSALFYPLLCVVAQGRKRVFLGSEEYDYNTAKYLVVSTDLPISGQVIEAPCLCATLSLEPKILAELLLELPPDPAGLAASKAVAVLDLAEDGLLDPLVRLLRLLDQPRDIPVLAPLIEREILYRLLQGPRGAMLRQLALPASQLAQISRALQAIRSRYDQLLRVDELARIAGMSAPSFHRNFRAVTAMSPLQYQKRFRLQEARRLLLSQEATPPASPFRSATKVPRNSAANTAVSSASRLRATRPACANL